MNENGNGNMNMNGNENENAIDFVLKGEIVFLSILPYYQSVIAEFVGCFSISLVFSVFLVCVSLDKYYYVHRIQH